MQIKHKLDANFRRSLENANMYRREAWTQSEIESEKAKKQDETTSMTMVKALSSNGDDDDVNIYRFLFTLVRQQMSTWKRLLAFVVLFACSLEKSPVGAWTRKSRS